MLKIAQKDDSSAMQKSVKEPVAQLQCGWCCNEDHDVTLCNPVCGVCHIKGSFHAKRFWFFSKKAHTGGFIMVTTKSGSSLFKLCSIRP